MPKVVRERLPFALMRHLRERLCIRPRWQWRNGKRAVHRVALCGGWRRSVAPSEKSYARQRQTVCPPMEGDWALCARGLPWRGGARHPPGVRAYGLPSATSSATSRPHQRAGDENDNMQDLTLFRFVLAEISDVRAGESGLEGLVTWNAKGADLRRGSKRCHGSVLTIDTSYLGESSSIILRAGAAPHSDSPAPSLPLFPTASSAVAELGVVRRRRVSNVLLPKDCEEVA